MYKSPKPDRNGTKHSVLLSPREVERRERAVNNFYNTMASANHGNGSSSNANTANTTQGLGQYSSNNSSINGGLAMGSGGGGARGSSSNKLGDAAGSASTSLYYQQQSSKSPSSSVAPPPNLGGEVRPMTIKDRFLMHADVSNQAARIQYVSNSALSRSPTLSTMTRVSSGVHLAAVTPLRAPPLPQPAVEARPTHAVTGAPPPPPPSKKYRRPKSDDYLLDTAVHNINSLAPGVYASNVRKPPSRGLGGGAFPSKLPLRMERSPITGKMKAISKDSDDEDDDDEYLCDVDDEQEEDEGEESYATVDNYSITGPGVPVGASGKLSSAPPLHDHAAKGGGGGGATTAAAGVSFDIGALSAAAMANSTNGNKGGGGASAADAESLIHAYSMQLAAANSASIASMAGASPSSTPNGIPIVMQKTFRLQAIAYTNPVVRLFRDRLRAPPLTLIESAVKGNRQNLLQPHQFYQWCLRVLWLDNPNFYKGRQGDAGGVGPGSGAATRRGGGNDHNKRGAAMMDGGDAGLGGGGASSGGGKQRSTGGGGGGAHQGTSAAMPTTSIRLEGGGGGGSEIGADGATGSYFDKRRTAQQGDGGGGGEGADDERRFDLERAKASLHQANPIPIPNNSASPSPGRAGKGAAAGLNATPTRLKKGGAITPQRQQQKTMAASNGGGVGSGDHHHHHHNGLDTDTMSGGGGPIDVSSSLAGGRADADAVQRLATPSHHTRTRARAMHKAQQQEALRHAGTMLAAPPPMMGGGGGGGVHSGFSPLLSSRSRSGGGGGATSPSLLMTPSMLMKRQQQQSSSSSPSIANGGGGGDVSSIANASMKSPLPSNRRDTLAGSSGLSGPPLLSSRSGATTMASPHSVAGGGLTVPLSSRIPTTIGGGSAHATDDSSDDDSVSVASACSDDYDVTPSSLRPAIAITSHAAGGTSPSAGGAAAHPGTLAKKGSNGGGAANSSAAAAASAAALFGSGITDMLQYDDELREVYESVTDAHERTLLINSLANYRRRHFLTRQYEAAAAHNNNGASTASSQQQALPMYGRGPANSRSASPRGGGAASPSSVHTYHPSSSAQEGDGAVDVFANAMRLYGTAVPFTRAEVQQVFQLIDANDDGVLEHREMCDGMVHLMSVDGPLLPLLHRFQTLVEPKFKRDVRLVRISRQELVLFQEAVVAVLLRQLRSKIRRRERFINHYRLSGVLFPADDVPSPQRRHPTNYHDDTVKRAAMAAKKGHTVITKPDGSILIVKEAGGGDGGPSSSSAGGSKSPRGRQTHSAANGGGVRGADWRRGGEDEYTTTFNRQGNANPANSKQHLPLPRLTEPFDALKAKKQFLVKYQVAKASGGARLDTRQKLSDFILPENENYFHALPSTQWFMQMEEKYGAGSANPFNIAFHMEQQHGNGGGDYVDQQALQREAEAKLDARRRREMVELGKIAALRKETARNAMQSRLERAVEVCPSSSLLTYLVALKRRDAQMVAQGVHCHPAGPSIATTQTIDPEGNIIPSSGTTAAANGDDDADDGELSDHDDYAIDLPLTSLRTLMVPSAVEAQIARRNRKKAKPLPRYMAATTSSGGGNATSTANAVNGDPSNTNNGEEGGGMSHEFLLEGMDKRPVPDNANVRAVLHYLDRELTLPIKLLEQTIRRFFIDYDQHILALIGAEPVSYRVIQDVLKGGDDEGDDDGDGTETEASTGASSPHGSQPQLSATTAGGGRSGGAAKKKTPKLRSSKYAVQLASAVPTPAKHQPLNDTSFDAASSPYSSPRTEGGGYLSRSPRNGGDGGNGRSYLTSASGLLGYSVVSADSSITGGGGGGGGPPSTMGGARGTSMEAAKLLEQQQQSGGLHHGGGAGSSNHIPYIRIVAQRYFVGKLPFEGPLRDSFLSYYYRELDADEGETVFKPMRQQLQHPTLERVTGGGSPSPYAMAASSSGVKPPHATITSSGIFAQQNSSTAAAADSPSPHSLSPNGRGGSNRLPPSLSLASVANNAANAVLFNPDSPRSTVPPMPPSAASSPSGNTGGGGGGGGGLRLPAINNGTGSNGGGGALSTMGDQVDAYGHSNAYASVGMLGGGGGGGGGGKPLATSAFFARRKTTAPILNRPAVEYTDVEYHIVDGRVVMRPKNLPLKSNLNSAGSAMGGGGGGTRSNTPSSAGGGAGADLRPPSTAANNGGGSSGSPLIRPRGGGASTSMGFSSTTTNTTATGGLAEGSSPSPQSHKLTLASRSAATPEPMRRKQ